jgi:tRNA uridine 5-carboxymethylaminomethyl modification enzyme
MVRDFSGGKLSASRWLRQPGTNIASLRDTGKVQLAEPIERLDVATLETTLKYEGYLRRQQAEVTRQAREENKRIPLSFKYAAVPGLSTEVVQRLSQIRPETLGQAGRIPGITPAALAVLSTFVSRLA